jgi:hypothetical protein
MAQAPSPTTTVPLTLPPEPAGAVGRVTVGSRQGWKLVDRSVLWDDGEREMPLSGLSDAEKRAEALAQALGTLPALQQGASPAALEQLRSESARTVDPEINERRKVAAKAKAAAPEQVKTVPLSAEQLAAQLRVEALGLVSLECARAEELKELAIGNTVVVGRDGEPVTGNVAQQLHDLILAAEQASQQGDLARTVAALSELKRWGVVAASS